MLIRIRQGWELPESEALPESLYLSRRNFLGPATAWMAMLAGAAAAQPPVRRNPEFTLDRPLTPEAAATSYNNFYEFDPGNKRAVRDKVDKFQIDPWAVEVTGLVRKPRKFYLDELLRRMPIEERLYRHRCVEAWSMAVPWTGFPLAALIREVEPLEDARYIRFVTALRPAEMPGVRQAPQYPWPYQEGLRLDEALNPLAILATGLYGKPLPKQNGAPIRLVVPWKYGFKSIKSIVRIEFTRRQPRTFWSTVSPKEYGFYANVDPNKPHPRWSQATERVLPGFDERPTLPYNGYAKWVAHLYTGQEF